MDKNRTIKNFLIVRQQAEDKARAEYQEFNKTQKLISEFDKRIQALAKPNKKKGTKK